MKNTVEDLKEYLEDEVKRYRQLVEKGIILEAAPRELSYRCLFSDDVIKAVMVENPHYFKQWPSLLSLLPTDIIKATLEKNPEMLDYWRYYDAFGNRIAPSWLPEDYYIDEDDLINNPTKWGTACNGFYSYTTHGVEETIDGVFGLFGLKDKNGNVITEEKYWDVGAYSNGLCPVREVNGDWGCINEKGELVIPCTFWEPPQFNKYGVAYGNHMLIDMQGNEIEGTSFNCIEVPSEDDRYYKLVFLTEEQLQQVGQCGVADDSTESIYDTKKREFIVRDIPEFKIDYYGFDGEPCVIEAAVELLKEYETVKVEDNGVIVAKKGDTQKIIYDYYCEDD